MRGGIPVRGNSMCKSPVVRGGEHSQLEELKEDQCGQSIVREKRSGSDGGQNSKIQIANFSWRYIQIHWIHSQDITKYAYLVLE